MAQNPKDLEYSILLDHYGPVLTQRQRDILTEYYDEDLSLSEIAENFGITRQGVRTPSSMARPPCARWRTRSATPAAIRPCWPIWNGWSS